MTHQNKKDLACALFLLAVIFFCVVVTVFSQSNDFDRWYYQWLQNGGWKQLQAQEEREVKLRQAQLEWIEVENLKHMAQLTIEIDQVDKELNGQLNLKARLWNEKLSSEKVEVSIKKLSKKLKGLSDALFRIAK